MTYAWFALFKTQMFDLIARHILEKIFDTRELSSEDMWWGSLFKIDLWRLNNFSYWLRLWKYQWRGTENKKSSEQRYRVSCSRKNGL